MTVSLEDSSAPNGGVLLPITVRWGDMDALGHVNNTLYFRYCESARIAYLDATGVWTHDQRGPEGPATVAANLNFRRQVVYPAELTVSARVVAIGERSYTFDHIVRDTADGQVVADGQAVCVWIHYAEGKALTLPDALLEAIARIERRPDLRRPGR